MEWSRVVAGTQSDSIEGLTSHIPPGVSVRSAALAVTNLPSGYS